MKTAAQSKRVVIHVGARLNTSQTSSIDSPIAYSAFAYESRETSSADGAVETAQPAAKSLRAVP